MRVDIEDGEGHTMDHGKLIPKLILTRPAIFKEIKGLGQMALPSMVGFAVQMSLTLILTFFMGHYGGALELGAIALGNMFCNVTGLTFGFGMATAMDTLCSQAYGHDNKSPLVGIILQRGIVIMTLMCFPIAIIWWNAEVILLALGQTPDVAYLAGIFARFFLPGLPAQFLFECLKKYLQAQGIMYVSTFALLFAACVITLCSYIFIYAFDLGFTGAPIAYSVASISLPIFTLIWIYWKGLHKDTWYGWSWEAFRGWPQFLRFGVPGMIMLMNEWWSFEVVAILAGWLGEVALAAQTVVLLTASSMFMITFGVGVAANVRVGNELGAGNAPAAYRSAVVGTFMGISTATLAATLIVSVRSYWGYVFSSDEDVVELVASVLLIYAVFAVFDGAQAMGSSILRGAGKQVHAAVISFISFYVLGLPIGYFLAFPQGLGLFGLWWGLCVALISAFVGYNIIIWRMNWQKEAQTAQERVRFENRQRPDAETTVVSPSGHVLLEDNDDNDAAADESTIELVEESESQL